MDTKKKGAYTRHIRYMFMHTEIYLVGLINIVDYNFDIIPMIN